MTGQTRPQLVYVIDDDEAVRDAIGMLLDSADLAHSSFASADEFLALHDGSQRGCLVLDIRMPGLTGLELQQRLADIGSTLPIIFITGHGDVPMAVEAMHNGAFDFIQKPYRDQDLLDRINQALAWDEEHRSQEDRKRELLERSQSLTPREREVMECVVRGLANKVIAMDLDLSQRTVEIHRARVMEKMHARSLAELVRMSMVLQEPA